ncbi:CBO0543 family protein [Mesobacillus foraminis]|uniref:CBO0543 family protein n=1 Tax=Mesobacillus foraminis TaxID=279826 RepID=UPI0015D592A6|nr:CBO0543 family protein [Mesobacillus foraminis]
MKDKIILRMITVLGLSGAAFLLRKGSIKDFFLIFLFKSVVSSLIDAPIARKKLVQYPYRYFKSSFNINIIFDFLIFPLLCVIYSKLTNKADTLKTVLTVFLLSVPMTIIEEILRRKTRLVKYSKKWSWFHTLAYLTVTFWSSRLFVAALRFLEQNRDSEEESSNDVKSDSLNGVDLKGIEETEAILRNINY